MPRGRAWQHSDDLSHQAWLKVLQGKRPPAEKWPRQSGAPKPGQPPVQPQPKIRGLHPDVKVSMARDRIAKLEAAIAAVGDEDETAPKLKEALRKARQQAQIPPIEVRVKSCEQFLDRARKNVLKAQEEVSKAQQLLMEAQSRHEERVGEVTEAERRSITLQTEAASHVAIMKDPIQDSDRPDWVAELDELRQKVNELQIENTELRGSCKRQAVSISVPVDRPGPRLKEDFVPGCDDDIFRWMQDRQADIQEATLAGNAHEVARLCHVMGSAVAGWSTPSLLPSMACNAVR